ncbi:MAG: hypothetical protein OXJ55_10795 [Caldilineaceae bacterium]|nr:hypothetical protein [Caldilineaceae bacterium]MDE0463097.1 hypothetical protein [Caldilineaceae bacterium]
MKGRIESLEHEVLELRVELRVLRRILDKVLDRVAEVPDDPYMALWDGRDGQKGEDQAYFMGQWRANQRVLQAMEDELANIKDKDSDEALHLIKQLESKRETARFYESIIHREAMELIEANIMATHNWRLRNGSAIRKTYEIRMEACVNPGCRATRELVRSLRDSQTKVELVMRSDPSPIRSCPWRGLGQVARVATHREAGEEDLPF